MTGRSDAAAARRTRGSAATPAIAVLARAGVAHAIHRYRHDPRSPAYGLEAAELLGVDPVRVLKTLIAVVDGEPTVALVPVADHLDLKALAVAVGGKHGELADAALAQRRTGYVVGGISPIGQRTALPTVIAQTALRWNTVFVSGGRRGLEIELAPGDLIALTGGSVAPIARER